MGRGRPGPPTVGQGKPATGAGPDVTSGPVRPFRRFRRGASETPTVRPVAESIQPPFGSHEERIAYNEAWCRHLNERKAKWMESGDATAGFRCECWRVNCGERLPLTQKDWQEVRLLPNRFAVAPDHVASELEAVVKKYPHFWLVEKHGEAGDIAKKLA